jgi:N-acetylglutamate synthase-like GNAT family acetyltransferase
MQTQQVRVGRARTEDRPAMERLLVSAGFGTHRLDDPRARWLVARLGEVVIACGCVSLKNSAAVLENLAVAASHRRRSIGSTLVGVLLDDAAEHGAANAYVTTRESGGFFQRLRWRVIPAMEAKERAGLTLQGDSQAFAVSLTERPRVEAAQYVECDTRVANSLDA